jgi:cytochrome c556
MKRVAVLALGLTALCAISAPPVPAQGDKPSEVKEIMVKVNKTGTGLYSVVVQELRQDDTNWDEVKKDAKEIARLGAMLGKLDPPKGEKDSWQKLTKAYAENTKALDTAAAKMDKDATKAAAAKLGESCDTCHKSHRKQ